MLTKLALGVSGSMGMLLLAEAGSLGLPGGWVLVSLLLNVFWFGWACHAFLSSYVGGMPPPDKNSSRAYLQFYNSAHLLLHRAPNTKEMWEIMSRNADALRESSEA